MWGFIKIEFYWILVFWFVFLESWLIEIILDRWFFGRKWELDVGVIFVVLYFLFLCEFCIWYDKVDIDGSVIMGIIESMEMFFGGWCCGKFGGLVMNMWLLCEVSVGWYVVR